MWKGFDVRSAWQTTLTVPITPGLSLRLRQFVQGSPRATKRWGIAFGGCPAGHRPRLLLLDILGEFRPAATASTSKAPRVDSGDFKPAQRA